MWSKEPDGEVQFEKLGKVSASVAGFCCGLCETDGAAGGKGQQRYVRSGASWKAAVGRAEKSLEVRLGLAAGSTSGSPGMVNTGGGGLWA